jgi:hypothetical protein
MKKLFEIDINEDYRRAIISQYFLMIFTFILSIVVRIHERSIIQFSFLVELLLFTMLFRFYFKAQNHRNYAYWGISFLLLGFLLKNILQYTFMDYNIFILYMAFLALIFLALNCYVMSSPLFYPRVQWWEYDYRYRGELRATIENKNNKFEGRLTDLRRGSGCVEAFEYIELEDSLELEVLIDNKEFILEGQVKTLKQLTPGRPIRYGVKFDLSDLNKKNTYYDLKKIWDENKRVKLRNKFAEIGKNGL